MCPPRSGSRTRCSIRPTRSRRKRATGSCGTASCSLAGGDPAPTCWASFPRQGERTAAPNVERRVRKLHHNVTKSRIASLIFKPVNSSQSHPIEPRKNLCIYVKHIWAYGVYLPRWIAIGGRHLGEGICLHTDGAKAYASAASMKALGY